MSIRLTSISAELLLPKGQQLEYEGRTYQTDAQGYSIFRADKEADTLREDSLDLSEIVPKRVGIVTRWIEAKPSQNFYDFIDSTIPENLDFNKYLIAGETPVIRFQSGMLAGDKEFEFRYIHKERRFEIVPQEIDGVTMPNDVYKAHAGTSKENADTYAIFGIQLPDEYICDNATKSGASWDMFREAAKYLYEHEEQKFTFTGTLQGLWSKRNWLNVGGHLKVGAYIHFTDEQFAQDGVDIRITGIKDFLTNPYAPTIEISNSVSGGGISTKINEIDKTEVVIEEQKKEMLSFTKRRFRDAKETLSMLQDSLLNFSRSVNPITVQTMAMLVGDESLQFRFVQNKQNPTPVVFGIEYDKANKQLHCPSSTIQHMTLGVTSITSASASKEYHFWNIREYLSPVLDAPEKKYYLYIRCNQNNEDDANFILSEEPKDMLTAEGGYYHFLCGILNSENEEERSYVNLYGFTEISPGRVTTDSIVSGDGKSFIGLAQNMAHIGDDTNYIDWNNEEGGTLVMNNARIKNALKVLGEALIAGFYFSNEKIRSTLMTGKDYSLLLDGRTGRIKLVSDYTGGDYSLDYTGSTIDIDSQNGSVECRSQNGVAYMSASGVFCNNALTNALPSSSGYTHYGSIVGLGFGNINKDAWSFDQESTIITGVYGRADNRGTAPAFGGYFWDLVAAGLILHQKYVTDTHASSALYLDAKNTQVVGLANKDKTATVYLPSDGYEGRVIFAKQIGQGAMRFYPKSGQKIFDDISANDYYDIGEGYEAKFTFSKFVLNGNNVEAWLVSRFRF